MIWISFGLYLDQSKAVDISFVFPFTNPLNIQSLQLMQPSLVLV